MGFQKDDIEKYNLPSKYMVKRIYCENLEETLKADRLMEIFELYSLEELENLIDKKKQEIGG